MGSLNRRALFGAFPIVGLATLPIAAHAVPLAPVQSEASAFEAGLTTINPVLGPLARQACLDGWKPSEMFLVQLMPGVLPALLFERQLPEVLCEKEGFEGWLVGTREYATYQHDREPTHDTKVIARDPNRGSH